MEDHCGKAGRSKVNRLLAKQTRLFSYIEGLQAETRVYYTLWQCGPELRILVSGEAGPAVRVPSPQIWSAAPGTCCNTYTKTP